MLTDDEMREKYNREGQAFPGGKPVDHWGDPSRGMTLRDYFAGQALMGLCAHPEAGELPNDGIACLSFALAEAMLKVREASE